MGSKSRSLWDLGVVGVVETAFGNLQVLEFGSFSRGNSDMGEDQSEFGYRLV
jgi:hypothetical protein